MIKQYKTEVIAVGTELLLGQIANTNAQWISQQLALKGLDTYYHSVVGDNINRVEKVFEEAHDRSDIIIVTGGLGPTDDDLTREAFQKIYNNEIITEEVALKKIIEFYKRQNSIMTPNNKKQARVFKESIVIPNEVGMAPGMIVNYEERIWVFLPGVPREMKSMATNTVFPYLQKLNGDTVIKSKVLRFVGIGESKLEHELKELIQSQNNPTIAPLAEKSGVTIRLTAKSENDATATELLESTKLKVLEKVGSYFYGEDTIKLEQTIIHKLAEHKLWISSAESLTGGMFAEGLIANPGASKVCRGGIICYDTSVKINMLSISEELIEKEGTVSEACAKEMAKQVAEKLNADIGISFTGVAGPDEVEGKNVGTVYIGISYKGIQETHLFEFIGDRQTIRRRSTLKGYELIYKLLNTL